MLLGSLKERLLLVAMTGIQLQWPASCHCLLSVCVWFLCSSTASSMHGVGCGGDLPCFGGH